jgi:hypothetical protein
VQDFGGDLSGLDPPTVEGGFLLGWAACHPQPSEYIMPSLSGKRAGDR